MLNRTPQSSMSEDGKLYGRHVRIAQHVLSEMSEPHAPSEPRKRGGYPERILQTTTLPETGYVRLPQILAVMPICAATWWNWVKSGRAPKPVNLGPRVTAWRASDIRVMLEAK